MAPHMFSPLPASMRHSGENPNQDTGSAEMRPMDSWEDLTDGKNEGDFAIVGIY